LIRRRSEELGFRAEQRVHAIPRNGEVSMTNRYKKAVIEDVVSREINEAEQSKLLDLFEHAMKSVATTLVREARFDTSDFATAKQANCEGFQLTLQRLHVDGRDVWKGQFSRAEQRLTVIASLE
jgi:hypothetical protein